MVLKKINQLVTLMTYAFFVFLSSNLMSATLSPQMIEQFKQLPKSEQQRLAQQYGISSISQLSNSSNRAASQQDDSRQLVYPRQVGTSMSSTDNVGEHSSKYDSQYGQDKELDRFGYDLFAGEPSTFAPINDVPVPSEYIIGPGDVFKIQLYGKESRSYELNVNRDGNLQFPELGPVLVAGMSFSEAKSALNRLINKKLLGVDSSISLGELRSIRIFVAGDAYKPGSYTVSSLSTITQALFVSGGINLVGSLRNIQLKRRGKLVSSLDLYDLLMRGDSSHDMRLLSGDVVFIPPVGSLVKVKGEVNRPAIYELVGGETANDIIRMAGGIRAGAFAKNAILERHNQFGSKSIKSLDLTKSEDRQTKVRVGDQLTVRASSESYDNSAITLIGAVSRPGMYQWRDGITISDVIGNIWSDLRVSADLDYGLVVRKSDDYDGIKVLQFTPKKAIVDEDPANNLTLKPSDKVLIFNYSDDGLHRLELDKLIVGKIHDAYNLSGDLLIGPNSFEKGFAAISEASVQESVGGKLKDRNSIAGVAINEASQTSKAIIEQRGADKSEQKKLQQNIVKRLLLNLFNEPELIKYSYLLKRKELLFPIIEKLRQQSSKSAKSDLVTVNGNVRYPGEYPLAVNAKVDSLVRASGGLTEGAYLKRAELSRINTKNDMSTISHQSIVLGKALKNIGEDNLVLQGRDTLTVMTIPEWQERQSVEIRGEVKFPGKYTIRRGETLHELLERAGGVTEHAFLNGAVFVRDSIKKQEDLEIKKFAERLRREMATTSLTGKGSSISYTEMSSMLSDLEKTEAVGRLVVDLPDVVKGIETADLQLEDKDVLYVPPVRQTVSVMGEVQFPATQRYRKDISLEDYVKMSGGMKKRADDDRVYIVKADGSVKLPNHSSWFSSESQLEPGDTIVVPLDTEYKDSLSLWSQITGIIYNTAVALAAISNV